MSAHSPGPWTDDGGTVLDADGKPIAQVDLTLTPAGKAKTFKEVEADARLIAAAPDLLEACRLSAWWNGAPGEEPGVTFDRIAEAFWRDTGFMRPGKSQPLEMHSTHSDAVRDLAWDAWRKKKQNQVRQALAAALTKAGR